MRIFILFILIHFTYGHSPIFVNSNKNTVVEPTHSWAYYVDEFSSNIHQWEADFEEDDILFVEFLTRHNQSFCFDIETTYGSKNNIHINITRKEPYLYCSKPFFEPYSVSNYDKHGTFQEVALNNTHLIISVEHDYQPFVLAVGKEESILFRDMLTFTWITAKVQGWSSQYSLGYNIIIAYSFAIAISILNDIYVNKGWNVLNRIYSVVSIFIIFSYIGNIFDKLYHFIRINDVQTLNTHDVTMFCLIHLLIPFVFIVFSSCYLFFRLNLWVECFVGECFTVHVSFNVLILFIFLVFSLFLFQPGAFMDIIFLVFALILEIFEIETSKKFKI